MRASLSHTSVVILSRKSMQGLFCNALETVCLYFSLFLYLCPRAFAGGEVPRNAVRSG